VKLLCVAFVEGFPEEDFNMAHSLIASDRVEGTAVYGADQEKIGSIERVMIDKLSGKVAYAVLSYGGFLGIGDDHYPTPWSSLKYDTSLEGYRIGITKDELDRAPKYASDNAGLGRGTTNKGFTTITKLPLIGE
jgi:hypothetical protein